MSISFKGYGENVLTFNSELTEVGVPAAIVNNCYATRAAANGDFIGFTTYADGKIAGVITDGYVEAKYTGAAPSYGYTALVGDGADCVKVSESSKHFVWVIKIDTDNNIVGFIL